MQTQPPVASGCPSGVQRPRRPDGWPIMHQTWGKLLFIHWPIDATLLKNKVPGALTLDTFNGQAWLAITPFTMWNIRPVLAPTLPFISRAHELNVRTYVHHEGVPGVWFFSLDINHLLGACMARALYFLPYYYSSIRLEQKANMIDYELHRGHQVKLHARWSCDRPLPQAAEGSLEYFLTERYALYAFRKGRLFRAPIWHQPWRLRAATLHWYSSTILESHGFTAPDAAPLVHYADRIDVEIWPLRRI